MLWLCGGTEACAGLLFCVRIKRYAHAPCYLFHTADVIADLLLITLPIRLIYGMTDRSLRRRLMFIFSTASASRHTASSLPADPPVLTLIFFLISCDNVRVARACSVYYQRRDDIRPHLSRRRRLYVSNSRQLSRRSNRRPTQATIRYDRT